MRATKFIMAKREGAEHSPEELAGFISGYLAGEIPDYQVAAWLMAVCWRGMTGPETAALTEAMAASGDRIDLSGLPHTVDKHSTGGVGDKTSLVLAPLLATCGATVAKMSGRGLGHTGGTIDKLESVAGFRSSLSDREFLEQARSVGVVIAGQSKELAPADGLLYALRDATATVGSVPLIASSVMSKKLAGGARSIVLDVKVGSGAFMKTLAEARELAQTMLAIGAQAGRRMRAVLSAMEEPLGLAVGNALEVREAASCLQGEGPADLRALCLTLASQVLAASGIARGEAEIAQVLGSGLAFERLERWIAAQGGDPTSLADLELAPDQTLVRAPRAGVLSALDALEIGQAVRVLGGGRDAKTDPIDLGVGLQLHAKVGDPVAAGEPVATLYHRGGHGLEEALRSVRRAISVADAGAPRPLILELLEA